MALPYAPGMSAQDIDDNDIVLTPDTAIPYLEEMFTEWLKKSIINPWCGICGAKTESWFYEDANTIFSSLEEALPHFARVEAEQLQTRKLFDEEIRGRSN